MTHDAWHAIRRPIRTQRSCDNSSGGKDEPESETAALGRQDKLFLWSSINKWWAFMSQIKNSCQLDGVHGYQHLSLSLSTLQDVLESEREPRDKDATNSRERHFELESSLFWRIKCRYKKTLSQCSAEHYNWLWTNVFLGSCKDERKVLCGTAIDRHRKTVIE